MLRRESCCLKTPFVRFGHPPAIQAKARRISRGPRSLRTARDQIHPVILSGGAGIRLWPLSRVLYLKQLMELAGEASLRQLTAARVAAPLFVCSDEHCFLVAEQLRALGIAAAEIVLEPTARNTALAACVAALRLAERDPAALLLRKRPVSPTLRGGVDWS